MIPLYLLILCLLFSKSIFPLAKCLGFFSKPVLFMLQRKVLDRNCTTPQAIILCETFKLLFWTKTVLFMGQLFPFLSSILPPRALFLSGVHQFKVSRNSFAFKHEMEKEIYSMNEWRFKGPIIVTTEQTAPACIPTHHASSLWPTHTQQAKHRLERRHAIANNANTCFQQGS